MRQARDKGQELPIRVIQSSPEEIEIAKMGEKFRLSLNFCKNSSF
jgi:hypothetical protein